MTDKPVLPASPFANTTPPPEDSDARDALAAAPAPVLRSQRPKECPTCHRQIQGACYDSWHLREDQQPASLRSEEPSREPPCWESPYEFARKLFRKVAKPPLLHGDDAHKAWLTAELAKIQELLAADMEKWLDNEHARWQVPIYELCKTVLPDVDGGGVDSGDPLDLTLSEISQVIWHLRERASRASSEPPEEFHDCPHCGHSYRPRVQYGACPHNSRPRASAEVHAGAPTQETKGRWTFNALGEIFCDDGRVAIAGASVGSHRIDDKGGVLHKSAEWIASACNAFDASSRQAASPAGEQAEERLDGQDDILAALADAVEELLPGVGLSWDVSKNEESAKEWLKRVIDTAQLGRERG